jgi:sulfite reductase alpha subunit-like flavoprotein
MEVKDKEIREDSNKIASDTRDMVSKDSPFSGVMVGNKRLTSEDHFQDVRLVQFDISGSGIKYNPGDVVWIYPR